MRRSALVLIGLLCVAQISFGQETLSQGRRNNYFQQGLDLAAHHQFGAAYDAFGRFLESASDRDPRTVEATYYRAYSAITLLHSDGEKLLEDFVEDHPNHPRAVLAYYDLANYFYGEKNYGKSNVYFAKVQFQTLNDEQQNVGRFRWGYSLFSQRNLLGALDQFNTIKSLGGQYGPAASYYAGFIESSAGDYDNALIDLKRAETSASYAPIVPPMIATIYQKQGKDDELLKYAEPLLDRDDISSTEDLALLTAEAWFRKGAYEKALPRYALYIGEHENATRPVLYRAGYSAWATKDDSTALSFLKRSASDVDSVGMHASYLMGSIYLKRGEKPRALAAFETCNRFKNDPRLAEESLFLSAKINYDMGRADQAIREFETVLSQYPQSSHTVEIKELLSQAYVNANNANKAISYIESLPHRTPAVDRAYQKATYLKGTELFNKEEYADAAAHFQKSLEYPLDALLTAEAGYWLGETFSIGRKYDQAIPHYEHALAHAAQSPSLIRSIRYGLGYARYNMQEYEKALISFREFVSRAQQESNLADGVLRMADCQYVLKSYGEALSSYRKVIQLKSADADYAHLQCGIILGVQRQYSEAIAELRTVTRNSNSLFVDEATFQLGQLDFERNNYASAIASFTTLINSSKPSRFVPSALSRRAAANYNLKNYGQTADDYIRVLDKYPSHPGAQDLLLPLQEALNLANRSGEFDKYLAQFKLANPEAKGIESVEFESAKNHYFSQRYPRAVETLSAFVTNYPQSVHLSEAKYYEAESYYRLKEYSRSLEVLKQVSTDPSFALRNKVVARIAELEFKLKHYDLAVTAFVELKGLAVNKKDEYTALNGLMESYYLLAQYDSSDVNARRIQQLGSVQANAQSKASLFLGKSAKARGDYETAKDEFLATINAAQDEYGAEAKYLVAEIFYLKGEHRACYETLISLNRDFATYEEWIGKSFLLLSDNYVATGETFQAKATLKSLIENFPKQEVRDLASEKLKAIEKDELSKQRPQKSDSTDDKP